LAKDEAAFFAGIDLLRKLNIISCHNFTKSEIKAGRQIIAEGAQGTLLDVRFGTRLDVTSSHTITAGIFVGLGIPPSSLGRVIGVAKAYATRVGNGPVPTEIGGKESFRWASVHQRKDEENLDYDMNDSNPLHQNIALRALGKEYGATTGRPRRVAWIDLPLLKYAIALNGVTHLGITKMDILDTLKKIPICVAYKNFKEVDMNELEKAKPVYKVFPGWKKNTRGCTSYKDLPKEAKNYLKFIEKELEIPIAFISTGPERSEIIDLKKF
jgi:adenylosuccinate synthase